MGSRKITGKILFTLKFYPMREVKLARVLREHGFISVAVGFSRRWSSFAKSSGEFVKVHDFTEFLEKQGLRGNDNIKKSIVRLEELRELYGLSNMELLVAGDRTMRLFPWERNIRLLDSLFAFWEKILETEVPDEVVGELSSAPDLVAWSMSKKLKIPYLCPVHSRLWENRFALSDSTGHWEELEDFYKEAKTKDLSEEDLQSAINFINRFRREKPVPSYMRYVTKIAPLQRISRLPQKLSSYLVDKRYAIDYPVNFAFKIREDLWSMLRRTLAQTKIVRLFDDPKMEEDFILFPLHYQPEATTLVYAPFCENQLAVAENVAKSLPVGYRLYVKEHKAMWGKRPFWFYRYLKAFPSIRLISPSINIHSLLKRCAAIVAITSTTGIEAILYGKPVIVLGNIFYDIFDCVYKVRSYDELPSALLKITKEFKPDEKEILRVVYSLIQSTYDGNMDDVKYNPKTLEEANLQKLASLIIQRIS